MSAMAPVQRLLGLRKGADSPFDLLGLEPTSCDEQAVRRALGRRLRRLAAHPLRDSHDADEVRLALHAAAAQLLDPGVRAHLIDQQRLRAVRSDSKAPPSSDPTIDAFVDAARRVLAINGRLNRATRRLLISLAHVYGLSPAGASRAMRLMGSKSGRSTEPSLHPPFQPPMKAENDAGLEEPEGLYASIEKGRMRDAARARRQVRQAAFGIGITALGLALITIVVLHLSDLAAPDDSAPQPTADSPASDTLDHQPATQGSDLSAALAGADVSLKKTSSDEEAATALPSTSQELAASPRQLVKALRESVRTLDRDPGEAAWRFERAVGALALSWRDLDEAELTATSESVVDFMYRAPAGGESADRAMRAVGRGASVMAQRRELQPDEIVVAAWSVGMLTRLGHERQLATQSLRQIDAMLESVAAQSSGASESTFDAGVLAALSSMTPLLPLTSPDAAGGRQAENTWSIWLETVEARSANLRRGDGEAPQRVILSAIETIMTTGPSPTLAPVTRDVMEMLLAAVDWSRPGAGARERVIQWFDDPAVEATDLSVMTRWMSGSGAVAGVSSSFVLSPAASADRRAQVRSQFARLWGLEDRREIDALALAWERASKKALKKTPADAGTTVAQLGRAVILSRLSEAAALRWAGDADRASEVVSNLLAPVEQALAPTPDAWRQTLRSGAGDDNEWVALFLGTPPQQVARRLEALRALDAMQGAISPAVADVLAEAALLSGHQQIMALAADLIERRREEPWVVNGVLEAFPQAPHTEVVSDLIERVTGRNLPPATDDGWALEARRALVERLLSLLSKRSDLGALDRLASLLEQSHQHRAMAVSGLTSSVSGDESAKGAAEAAQALRGAWREQAKSRTFGDDRSEAIGALDRRLRGRLELAKFSIERFTASQIGAVELMGVALVAERPSRSQVVRQTLDSMARSLRAASGVTEQIEIAEHAALSLWLIRAGDNLPEDAT